MHFNIKPGTNLVIIKNMFGLLKGIFVILYMFRYILFEPLLDAVAKQQVKIL